MKNMDNHKNFILFFSLLGSVGLMYGMYQISELRGVNDLTKIIQYTVSIVSLSIIWVYYSFIDTLIDNINYLSRVKEDNEGKKREVEEEKVRKEWLKE